MGNYVLDPKGNKLSLVVLQVISRHPDGRPEKLALRYDEERFEVSEGATFILVWAAAGDLTGGGQTALGKLVEDLDTVKAANASHALMATELRREADTLHRELKRIQVDNEAKTAELRALQRERDPERLERLIAERVAAATADLEAKLAVSKGIAADLNRTIDELRASKRKLREALDRAKEGRQ